MSPPIVQQPLFFLDYDGTLAPIVDEPSEAVPHPDVPALLHRLEARYPVCIVTGRHLRDLSAFLPDLALQAIGLHGAQEGFIGGDAQSLMSAEVASVLRHMRDRVPDLEGVRVEDKEYTFAVHYRGAEDEQVVRKRLEAWAEQAGEELEVIWGKAVLELRPKGIDKGTAVTHIARQYPHCTPVYLGDDVTDEDAFRALGEEAITIKVGDGDTAARYRLPGPEAVVRYLEKYVEAER